MCALLRKICAHIRHNKFWSKVSHPHTLRTVCFIAGRRAAFQEEQLVCAVWRFLILRAMSPSPVLQAKKNAYFYIYVNKKWGVGDGSLIAACSVLPVIYNISSTTAPQWIKKAARSNSHAIKQNLIINLCQNGSALFSPMVQLMLFLFNFSS